LPRISFGIALLFVLALSSTPRASLRVEVLRAAGSLPPHIVGLFEPPAGFQQASSGVYYVFDRGGHAVFTVDPDRTGARKAVSIGQESGRIIQPVGFDVAPDGSFVVADVPRSQGRVQTFDVTGARLGGFFTPGAPPARITIGDVMINGVGSIQYTGKGFILSHPETGALFTEYTLNGTPTRSIGRLRSTRYEDDRELHIAMNAGLPLADPTGGFYYVFLAGRPAFRKFDARGTQIFERQIEGIELDPLLDAQPTVWPRRRVEEREVPFVAPAIRAAAVDPRGQLWVSLAVPYTYVYDAQGDKVRTLQLTGAGTLMPSSLSFGRNGRLLVAPGLYEFDVR